MDSVNALIYYGGYVVVANEIVGYSIPATRQSFGYIFSVYTLCSSHAYCWDRKTVVVHELWHNSQRLSHSLNTNPMQKAVNAVSKENKHCEFVYGSSELNLLRRLFFHNRLYDFELCPYLNALQPLLILSTRIVYLMWTGRSKSV
ncbi:ENTH/VHS domain containing protein [Dorcoceras hygrometricum]|uniref:ENTH/VHS domain containing protein n=1 Tax=Dorcoceras hygrometricum TaxID=472368 RepID=A0A2Z7DHX1_9LAMI|nr:ENTH/VHS domain containing protein [Dorcoceras hygrometricum]